VLGLGWERGAALNWCVANDIALWGIRLCVLFTLLRVIDTTSDVFWPYLAGCLSLSVL
jgi:hypothetical protein